MYLQGANRKKNEGSTPQKPLAEGASRTLRPSGKSASRNGKEDSAPERKNRPKSVSSISGEFLASKKKGLPSEKETVPQEGGLLPRGGGVRSGVCRAPGHIYKPSAETGKRFSGGSPRGESSNNESNGKEGKLSPAPDATSKV